MESLLRPKEQEVFRSTEWKRYQVDGKSKTKKGYVNGFEIYTRVVDTSEKVTGAERGQMTSQNISSSQKLPGNPLFMQGAKAPYGKPIDFPHPLAPKEQSGTMFEQLLWERERGLYCPISLLSICRITFTLWKWYL